MQKNKIIYWASTGIIAAMMLFSGYAYFTNPGVKEGFMHLGFPDFFRVELGIAKIIAAILLIVPQVPVKLKEWAYAGLTIVFISAIIAHLSVGDPAGTLVTPIVLLVILGVSNLYLYLYKNKISSPSPQY